MGRGGPSERPRTGPVSLIPKAQGRDLAWRKRNGRDKRVRLIPAKKKLLLLGFSKYIGGSGQGHGQGAACGYSHIHLQSRAGREVLWDLEAGLGRDCAHLPSRARAGGRVGRQAHSWRSRARGKVAPRRGRQAAGDCIGSHQAGCRRRSRRRRTPPWPPRTSRTN